MFLIALFALTAIITTVFTLRASHITKDKKRRSNALAIRKAKHGKLSYSQV